MSKREVKLYLTDIDDAISAIQSYTKDMTYEQLLSDRKTREAIILNFVVMGKRSRKSLMRLSIATRMSHGKS